LNNLPIDPLKKMGAEVIIGVDVIPRSFLHKLPVNLFSVADRSIDILLKQQTISCAKDIDVLIEPVTEAITSIDFHKKNELIKMGEIAAIECVDQIKKLIY